MAKPSAASRTLDLFGSPLPPSFGGKGIVAFEDRPESNKMPLFGHNLVEKGFGTLPVVAKPQPVAAKPQKKTKLRKPPKRKKIGSARVNRRVAANLAKRLAEARAELAQCQARSTRSSSRSSSKRAGTPKKSGPTRKQLVARILSLQEQLAACEGRSSTVERTSITDANVEPDEVFRIAFEPDYDDPIEHSLAETERAEVAKTDAARKTNGLAAHGNTNQRLAAVVARKDGPLADAGDDEGHVSERVQQLLAEATEAERKAVELAELIVRGPGETKALAEKNTHWISAQLSFAPRPCAYRNTAIGKPRRRGDFRRAQPKCAAKRIHWKAKTDVLAT